MSAPVQARPIARRPRLSRRRRAAAGSSPRCRSPTATGAPNSPPTPRSNPTTSCSSSGCIRRRTASGSRKRRPLIDKAVRSILDRQLADGGFNIYVKGPSEVSASVKAYFALKLAGIPADDPRMLRLRERILAMGGIQAANSYVKVNLSLFDLYPRAVLPHHSTGSGAAAVQLALPDVVVDARHCGFALHRACGAIRAARFPRDFNLDELWTPGASRSVLLKTASWLSWHNIVSHDRLVA